MSDIINVSIDYAEARKGAAKRKKLLRIETLVNYFCGEYKRTQI